MSISDFLFMKFLCEAWQILCSLHFVSLCKISYCAPTRYTTKDFSNGRNVFTMKHVRPSLMMLLVFSLITGVGYPLLVTGIAQLTFPRKANGSLMQKDGKLLGSELIGQQFMNPKYFWGRLSSTSLVAYNAEASSGSNAAPTNPALLQTVQKRIKNLKEADPQNTQLIPVDLVTASGSGLDPHISVAAALYQLPRVARIRGMREERIHSLLDEYTEGRQFGFLGEPRVNVLKLNLALDGTQTSLEAQ